jgi:hypothetical protein
MPWKAGWVGGFNDIAHVVTNVERQAMTLKYDREV